MVSNTSEVALRPGSSQTVRRVALLWRRLITRLLASLHQSASYSRPNMVLFGIVAVVGHPLYYVWWNAVQPQAFESMWLRLFSAAVAVPMLFGRRVAHNEFWRRKLTAYWFFILIYQLPFFFVFMALMNDFSPVWALSTMAACLLLVLLVFDWLMILLLAAIGTALAWSCFVLLGGEFSGDALAGNETNLQSLIPIYLFTLVAGSIFNYKTELVAREKLAAITAAVGTMAHELRTPLLGIRSGARGLQDYLPAIFDGFEQARAHGLPVKPIRTAHYRQLHAVLDRISAETEYTNVILDMLLVNSSRTSIDRSAFERVSIKTSVDTALERFPFHSGAERERVSWQQSGDFVYTGSQMLMVHVLFNLIKNALYFLARTDGGCIRIWTEHDVARGVNRLHFRDNGPGIAPDVLPHVFERFFSGMPAGQGTGIGLAFAALVMSSFGGTIRCHSVVGRYTEFVMTFPAIEDR